MNDPEVLLRELVNAAATLDADRYLEQLAQTGASADTLRTLLARFEQKIERLEALHIASTRDIAKEILVLTRAIGKGRAQDLGPLTGWRKLDMDGQALRFASELWSATVDRGNGLMWTVNVEQSGELPHPCRQVSWRTALELLAQLNYDGWCGYRDWRIPTLEELYTLSHTKDGSSDASISAALFPDLRGDRVFWSSTRFANSPSLLALSFTGASPVPRQRGERSYLRFVRTASADQT